MIIYWFVYCFQDGYVYGRMYDKQSSRLEADLIQFRYMHQSAWFFHVILCCIISWLLHVCYVMSCYVMLCYLVRNRWSEKFSSTCNNTSFLTSFRPIDVSLAEPSVRCHVIVTAGKCKGTRGTVKVPHTHMRTVADIHTRTLSVSHSLTHTHTHTHKHTHTHTHKHTHIHTRTHKHKHIHTRTHTNTHSHTHRRFPFSYRRCNCPHSVTFHFSPYVFWRLHFFVI